MKKILLPLILILFLTFTLIGDCWVAGYDQRIKLTTDNTKIDSTLVNFPVTVFFTSTQAEEIFAEFDADEDFDRGQFASGIIPNIQFQDTISPNYANDFDVYDSGNRTIIAEYNGNIISLYNSTDKSNLVLLDNIAITKAHDVRVIDGDNDYAYYVSYDGANSKFGILNLTNESAIAIEDSITLADAFYCRAYNISGSLIVFVVTHGATGGLYIYDVTDHTITLLDSITGNGANYNIDVAWRVQYHSSYDLLIVGAEGATGCTSVFDVSVLTDITPTAKYEGADWKWINIFIEGNKVYGTASGLDKIEVATINANGTLTELGDYTSSDYLDNVHGIYVENDIIYTSVWFSNGITILDAADPANIIYVTGQYDSSLMNQRHAIEKVGDYIWTAGATTYFTVHSYVICDDTLLYAEKGLFDDSEQKAIYHIKYPNILKTSGTDIYFYYDNDAGHNTSYIGIIGSATATEVWDDYYIFVCHGVDDTTSTVLDSTSNNNDGTKKAANEPIEATGKVGQGQDFDGNDYISVEDSASLDFTAGFTLEMIADPDFISGDYLRLLYRYDATSTDGYLIGQLPTGSGLWQFLVFVGGTNDGVVSDSAPSGAFQHITGRRDTNGALKMYVNGAVQADTGTKSGAIDATEKLYLGCDKNLANFYAGIEDEIRISNAARTAAWIKATYNSLWDSLLTYGSEETEGITTNVMFMFSDF